MDREVTHQIRGWLIQNAIVIASGGGESCQGRISILVQSKVNIANPSQDKECHPPIVVIHRLANKLIPECTELELQFGRRILCIEFRSCQHVYVQHRGECMSRMGILGMSGMQRVRVMQLTMSRMRREE